jgi:hypothetical protein
MNMQKNSARNKRALSLCDARVTLRRWADADIVRVTERERDMMELIAQFLEEVPV